MSNDRKRKLSADDLQQERRQNKRYAQAQTIKSRPLRKLNVSVNIIINSRQVNNGRNVSSVQKLGILMIKQLSRPIANVIKDKAKENQYFRQYVAMPPAYFYNWVNIKVRMWSLNLGKPTNIPQLNEAMAIELGSTLLGEIILFAVPATILVFEYIRQSRKEARKQEEILIEKLELVNTINNLELHVERQDVQLKRIKKTLEDLASKRWNNKVNDQFEDSPLHLKRLPLPEP